MTLQLTGAIARIRQTQGKVVGAGFLVTDRHILTCAHVVNAALNRPLNAPDRPDRDIQFDFPLVTSTPTLNGQIFSSQIFSGQIVRWLPVQPSTSISPTTGADIALLELASPLPQGAQPIRLVKTKHLWKHPFRVFGFPEGQAVGVWTDGIISNPQANGRVQIEVVRTTAYPIEPGFSGSPVWDEQLDGVAGMTVAIDSRRPTVRAAFIIPTAQLIQACPELAEQAIPPCPYQGLAAFQEQNAQFFFGRETFTQQLLQAVRRQSLVAVIGASGSGKSSLVFAGLIPQLRSEDGWLIATFRPGDRPFRNLAARLVPLLETGISETDRLVEVNKQATALQTGDLTLQDIVSRILEKHAGNRLLLIADQFEELYTLCPKPTERQLFLDRVLATGNQIEQFTLVLTLRADFCGYALDYRPFADALQDADRKLGPMNRAELQMAIENPAQQLGVRLESGLTERILATIENEPGNLPLLEFALTLLWAQQQNGQLTHQAYEAIGGVEKALADYAEAQYSSLSQVDKQRAEQIFIQLVRPGEGTEDTRRLATRAEVGAENWDLVTRLASARLVVTNKTGKTREREETDPEITAETEETDRETVEIIHEALIREWGTLRSWIEANRQFRTWQERVRNAIAQWQAAGKKDEDLLVGSLLLDAEDKWQSHLEDVSPPERHFIQLSLEFRQRKEKAEQNRRKLTISGLVGSLVTVSSFAALAAFGWWQTKISETNREIESLSLSAASLLNSDKYLDGLIESLKVGKKMQHASGVKPETKMRVATTLHQAVYGIREFNRIDLNQIDINAEKFSVSPDGRFIVSFSKDRSAKLWDNEGNLIKDFPEKANEIKFSSNSQVILLLTVDYDIQFWNKKGDLIRHWDYNFSTYKSYGDHLIANPTCQVIALFDINKKLQFSDQNETLLKQCNFSEFISLGSDKELDISPDGNIIFRDSDISLWDFYKNSPKKRIDFEAPDIMKLRFSPDGKIFVSASGINAVGAPGEINLWTYEGNHIKTMKGHNDMVFDVNFSPDGKKIVSASADGTIKLWSVDGTLLDTFKGHNGWVRNVGFSSDGQAIVSFSDDDTVRFWSIKGISPIILQSDYWHFELDFSPDSKTIASSTGRLWDVNGNLLLSTKTDSVYHLNSAQPNFSPDNQFVTFGSQISFSADGKALVTSETVELWNLNGKLVHTISEDSLDKDNTFAIWHKDREKTTVCTDSQAIARLLISPNGRIIASANNSGRLILWKPDCTKSKIWNVPKGEVSANSLDFIKNASKAPKISFSPDGKTIASVNNDGVVILWDLEGKKLKSWETPSNFADNSITFSPNGKMIALGGDNGFIKILNLNGSFLKSFQADSGSVGRVSFSPDSQFIVADDDRAIKLWSIDGTLLQTFYHHASVASVAFSPDGQAIASGSRDGTNQGGNINPTRSNTVILWNLNIDYLLMRGCDLVKDYLKSPYVNEEDRYLCDDIELSPSYLIEQGVQFAKEGDLERTINKFQEAKELDPKLEIVPEVEARKLISESLMRAVPMLFDEDKSDRAIEKFKKAIEFNPNIENTGFFWGNICTLDKLWLYSSDIIFACDKAVESEPENPLFLYNRGVARAIDNNIDKAIQDFQNSIKLADSTSFEDSNEKQKLEALKLQQKNLIAGLQQGHNTALANSLIWEGAKLAEEGKAKKAVVAYKSAQKADPYLGINPAAWEKLCWIGSLKGNANDVIYACDQLVKLEPVPGRFRGIRGVAKALANDIQGAIGDFEANIKWLNSKDATSQFTQESLDQLKQYRQNWVYELRQSKNPIKLLTPEEIEGMSKITPLNN